MEKKELTIQELKDLGISDFYGQIDENKLIDYSAKQRKNNVLISVEEVREKKTGISKLKD